jgi:hypothetical protein
MVSFFFALGQTGGRVLLTEFRILYFGSLGRYILCVFFLFCGECGVFVTLSAWRFTLEIMLRDNTKARL